MKAVLRPSPANRLPSLWISHVSALRRPESRALLPAPQQAQEGKLATVLSTHIPYVQLS